MAKIVCDLDCSNIAETFVPYVVDKVKTKITHAIYEARLKVHGDDVLVLHIAKMQMVFLNHVWSELLVIQKCNVEIILDNLASESELNFILRHALMQTNVMINEIKISNINIEFPDEAIPLIAKYCNQLKQANIVTTMLKKLEISSDEEKQMVVMSPTSSPLAAFSHFAKPSESQTAPVVTAIPGLVV
jgi:hypothetical protein